MIIEAFRERAVSLPVDMEHSTEIKAPNGEPAPAVGWIEDLEDRGGAVGKSSLERNRPRDDQKQGIPLLLAGVPVQ